MFSLYPKRLIMTIGDSRIGKSTVMRLLIDLLYAHNKQIKAYDHDNRFKLAAYSQIVPVQSINFFQNGTDIILEDFKGNYSAIALDMPGQHLEQTCKYIQDVNLFKLLADYGWRLTFLHPISHRLDCLEYLESLLCFCGKAADYIIVKNQHFDDLFTQYQRSSVPDNLIELAGTEIFLKGLNKYAYEATERFSIPYSQVSKKLEIYSVYRAYTHSWVKNFYNSIQNNPVASHYLGLTEGTKNNSQQHKDEHEHEYVF